MSLRAAAAVLACILLAQPARTAFQAAPEGVVLVPFVFTETFAGDSLGQWASYPPAQDVGYEPSLAPTSGFDAPGGRALMRIVRPVVDGPLRFGFIREMNLVLGEGDELSLAYRLEPAGLTGALELGLAGGDGHRYVARVPARAGAWTTTSVKLSGFRGAGGTLPPARLTIEAVYVVADVERANPDVTCRFLMDDVRLAASRPAAFEVREPDATRLDPWRARPASTPMIAGQPLSIEAAAPVPLRGVSWSLTAPTGKQMASGALRSSGSSGDSEGLTRIWKAADAYRLAADDPRGIWRLTLVGTTSEGRKVVTDVRLLAPREARPHPRLFFDREDIATLRARRSHPALGELWSRLQKAAAASRGTGPIAHGGETFARLDSKYLLPTLLGYFDVLNRARARIGSNAAVALIDQDGAARAAARQALLEVSRWPQWAPPWFSAHGQHTYYPAGQLATVVATAYDFLYDDLSDEERRLVRRALMERSILPTWREYVVDNRIMADTSNWLAHTVGGAIIAATAILGDGDAEEQRALVPPLNGLLMKIEDHMAASFLPDGSYGEGISYLEFDLETLGPMLWAVERVLGHSYWQSTHVVESLRYPLFALADPIDQSLDMGDTHPPAGHSIHPVIARSTDPVLRWYGERFERRTLFDFLFFDDSVAPRPPAGSASRVFADKGHVVFRTGWGGDDGLMMFRAGPTFNHNHADQGSFQFRALGETLITEAGWSDYYKDPYYETFFTQAAGHNTLLVDGNPASQVIADTAQFAALREHPRLTDVTLSSFHDALGSDLTPVYRDQLESYARRLVYLKPDYLVLFDRVRAREPARLDVRLHVPAKSGLTLHGAATDAAFVYTDERAALAVRPFSSVPTRLTVGDGRIPYPVLAARTPEKVPAQPAYVDLGTTMPVADAWFMMALVPGRSAETARAAAARLTQIAAAGWAAFADARDGVRDLVAFSTGELSAQSSLEGWRTDAAAFTAREAGGDLRRIAAQQVRHLSQGTRTIVSAESPVEVAFEYEPTSVAGVITAGRGGRLRLWLPHPPARATLGERAVTPAHDRSTGLTELSVPAGTHAVTISWVADR